MILKDYQIKAVSKLYSTCLRLLGKEGSRVCAFKAPTGSGKTIMAAALLERFSEGEMPNDFVYLWISSNNLHTQSKDKVSGYLKDSQYAFLTLDEVIEEEFEKNQIVFINWESLTKQDREGNFINLFMKESETGRNLPNLIANTKKAGLEIILIVDESHYHYWSKKSQELVAGVIAPQLILEVSATPAVIPTAEETEHGEAGFVSVSFKEVVDEGMVKISTIVNEEFRKYSNLENTADDAVLDAAIAKIKDLKHRYEAVGSEVKPLLIIQLPSETEKLTDLDLSRLRAVETILFEEHDITVANGKLAVWLSNRKDNVDGITDNDSSVQVLIFKQAVALGWDCPRAQILVMFRDIKIERFEIQTVGRIMRMPETHHYEDDILNHAYVFTNLSKIKVAHDGDSKGYFRTHRAVRKSSYKSIRLPSVYLSRIEYGDLTLSFRKLFMEETDKKFGITTKDDQKTALKKVDNDLDLLPKELAKIIISDAIIENLDEKEKQEVIGRTKAEFAVSPDEIKRAYETFAKIASLPYAPIRSHTKIQQAIYDWFDKRLGYERKSRLEIQRIVVCSETNQKIFKEIIEAAKVHFKEVDRNEKSARQAKRQIVWEVPETDYFNENYEEVISKRALMVSAKDSDKSLLQKERSKPEVEFEQLIDDTKSVDWWYKNGEGRETYFAIPYVDPDSGFERSFYPDYIIQFADRTLGIFDTKSGFTKDSIETTAKSNALQAYLHRLGKKYKGGIVTSTKSGWLIFIGKQYRSEMGDWHQFKI